jgi:hypothetical protein
MSWQDVRGWYEGQDDPPDPGPVEVIEKQCWWCDKPFRGPADEPERFCSAPCDLLWCEDANQAYARALIAHYRQPPG